MQWTLTRRLFATSIAAALALGGAACGGDNKDNNTPPTTKTPKITAFNASKTSVASGEKVTLSWTVENTTSVSVVAAPGGAVVTDSTMVPTGSAETAAITENTTFTLTAKDGNGKSATAMATVTVQGAATVVISSFTASPNPAPLNGSTTLAWATTGATSVKIFQGATQIHNTDTAADVANGTFTVQSLSQPTYTFRLEASAGTETQTREVTVTTMATQTTTETEPNDTSATANPIATGAASGSLGSATDADFYSITVPADGNVTAQTSDGMGGCAAGFDSILTLIGSDGTTELGSNDDYMQGSGCSMIDPVNDAFASGLAAGTYYLRVTGYNGALGDYVLTVSVGTKMCGNGITEAGEECDDGNTASGDNCTPTCTLDTAGTINPPSGDVTVTVPTGDVRLVSIVIATAGQSIHAVTSDPSGACPTDMDTRIGLFTQAQDFLGLSDDDAMGGACASFENGRAADGFAHDLDAGTYLLVIANQGAADITVKLHVDIVNPGCGNGIVEGRTMEQCDDGNASSGDGCSSVCHLEPVATLMGPPINQTLNDAINPGTQQDLYEITLTADAYLVAETFAPMAGTCTPTTTDTVIELLDSTFQTINGNDDHDNVRCSRMAPRTSADLLTAGTYYLRVYSYDASVIASYALTVQTQLPGCGNGLIEGAETCDDGNTTSGDGCSATCAFEGTVIAEMEMNNTAMQANGSNVQRGQTVIMQGAIDPVGDVDYFSFDITGGNASVKLQTHTVVGSVTTCTDADTKIYLFDPAGTELVNSDDEGAGLCSLIDGTGMTPANMEAANLAPGHYTVAVHYYDDSATITNYFLSITLQ